MIDKERSIKGKYYPEGQVRRLIYEAEQRAFERGRELGRKEGRQTLTTVLLDRLSALVGSANVVYGLITSNIPEGRGYTSLNKGNTQRLKEEAGQISDLAGGMIKELSGQ